MEYKLIINEDQAEILCKALDLFSRIGCGQFEEILRHPTIAKRIMEKATERLLVDEARHLLDMAKLAMTGYDPGTSTGITVADEPNRVAFDIFQVIRNRLAIDNNDHELSVHRHEPKQWSEQPLPAIRVITKG